VLLQKPSRKAVQQTKTTCTSSIHREEYRQLRT
jgi:hypothetical protein